MPEEQRMDIGIVRRTGNNIPTAFGSIGKLFIVIEDDIQGRPISAERDLVFDISGVKVINVLEEVLPAEPISTQSLIVGYKEEIIENLFGVYPNPTQSFINVDWLQSSQESATMSILNVAGLKVLETQQLNRIDISFLSPGLYHIEIETNDGVGYSKFIKN